MFHLVSHERLQTVIWSVVDVAHESAQHLVAGSLALLHIGHSSWYRTSLAPQGAFMITLPTSL